MHTGHNRRSIVEEIRYLDILGGKGGGLSEKHGAFGFNNLLSKGA